MAAPWFSSAITSGFRGDLRYFRQLSDPDEDNEFDIAFGDLDYLAGVSGPHVPLVGRSFESFESFESFSEATEAVKTRRFFAIFDLFVAFVLRNRKIPSCSSISSWSSCFLRYNSTFQGSGDFTDLMGRPARLASASA